MLDGGSIWEGVPKLNFRKWPRLGHHNRDGGQTGRTLLSRVGKELCMLSSGFAWAPQWEESNYIQQRSWHAVSKAPGGGGKARPLRTRIGKG